MRKACSQGPRVLAKQERKGHFNADGKAVFTQDVNLEKDREGCFYLDAECNLRDSCSRHKIKCDEVGRSETTAETWNETMLLDMHWKSWFHKTLTSSQFILSVEQASLILLNIQVDTALPCPQFTSWHLAWQHCLQHCLQFLGPSLHWNNIWRSSSSTARSSCTFCSWPGSWAKDLNQSLSCPSHSLQPLSLIPFFLAYTIVSHSTPMLFPDSPLRQSDYASALPIFENCSYWIVNVLTSVTLEYKCVWQLSAIASIVSD